ncbi:transporter substrate-binding domain-containing protein [Marasmitruncus massiliensis]|uniref:transporter substrate-binding domain-containing protein n=1 Tax=Marasmitruncus massiliensis TaxID=1944642 RepID=UPI000C7E0122|nr:transporter substrate-binding domain-containing protein [Marasmitruncus massiliensis]
MNSIKKWTALALTGMLLLSTAACGTQQAPAASSAPAASTAASSEAASGGPTLDKIKAAGVLKVGVKVDVPNFGLKNTASGEVEGFEIDLAKRIAKDLLGDETKLETQAVTAKTRGPLLDTGELDLVIATFTITEERKLTYNFSQPYYTDAVKLMVKKDAGITGLKDLDGKTIGVAQSATSMQAIQAAADELGVKIKFDEYPTYPEIKAALDSGRVDCFSVDGSILSGYVDDSTVILDEKYSPQEYGIASKLDNKDLAEFVDAEVAALKSSGELDQMIETWGLN